MLELRQYGLKAGDSRRVDVPLDLDPVLLGGSTYAPQPVAVQARIDLQATPDGLYMKLRYRCDVVGPCYRCLEPARAALAINASEYHEHTPAAGTEDDATSDYLEQMLLDVERWSRDAMVLALPEKVLCRPDCRGLCPVCGANLNDQPEHSHAEQRVDERWAKLRELQDAEGWTGPR